MVEYVDGSLLAQLGTPDMKVPIAHALAYPKRMTSGAVPLDLFGLSKLEFIAPDTQKFACLSLARQAIKQGNGATIILNAVNEVAVQAFLRGQIALTDIAILVEQCLEHDLLGDVLSAKFDELEAIMALDSRVRVLADNLLANEMLVKW